MNDQDTFGDGTGYPPERSEGRVRRRGRVPARPKRGEGAARAFGPFRPVSPSPRLPVALILFLVSWWFNPVLAQPPPPAAELVEEFRTKVVLVHVRVGVTERAGTGFIAGPGLVLTSEHVVRDARRTTVWINETAYAATVLRADATRDLAVLAVRDVPLAIKALPLANAGTTREGESLVIIGCHPILAEGRIPRIRQSIIGARFRRLAQLGGPLAGPSGTVELAASVEQGDSGSPVIRLRDGAVIGVVRARNLPVPDGRSWTAWAVPSEAARDLLPTPPPAVARRSPVKAPAPPEDYYLAPDAHRSGR
jgi:S1-C subfamily serine protease